MPSRETSSDTDHARYPAPFTNAALADDPFVKGLKQRLPETLRESFTDAQLEALRQVFGARSWVKHKIDLRGTFRLLGGHYYYFAVLAGRNKRGHSRTEPHLSLAAKAALATLFLLFSTLLGLAILYLVKSALGIDLLPNYSLGLWDWFKANI
ncbi:3-phosphoshikimate 1-carboxyvinyltransferase [Stutzerimonas degradans]|uniref:3-phosphoshikimate 1-carboxyvinyltransferase n=1 Tax=Stutzerimonas degradans TaxID=2968968 RepID=UPI0028D09B57|nr:3-phosphoshikimate 1-carboxyvinyltransferase [Stutzerimonas degradans]